MIPKSGYRFFGKDLLTDRLERDDDSKKSHPALVSMEPCNGFNIQNFDERLGHLRNLAAVTP